MQTIEEIIKIFEGLKEFMRIKNIGKINTGLKKKSFKC